MAKKQISPEYRTWQRGKYKGWRLKDIPDDYIVHQLWLIQNNKRKQQEDPYVHIIVQEAHRRQTQHKACPPVI